MRRTIPLLLAALALAATAAGCGSSKSSSSTSTAAPAAGGGNTVTIDMKNIQFAPKSATVKVGQTVKWVNQDSVQHNVIAESGASFKSSDFGSGATFEFKPTKAATIKYVCTLHPGMTGELTVR